MNFYVISHIGITLATLVLGVLVFSTNRRRTTNQVFLMLSLLLVAWLVSLGVGFSVNNKYHAMYAVRCVNAIGAFMPFIFMAFRLSVVHPRSGLLYVAVRSLPWFGMAVAVGGMCMTPFFLNDVVVDFSSPFGGHIPEPVYGPGILVYGFYQIISLTLFVFLFTRDYRRSIGIVKLELQFLLLASAIGFLVAVLLTVVMPIILNSSQMVRMAPVAVILFVGFIAYGIATRRIMDVGYFLRGLTAYSLLSVYLAAIYYGVYIAMRYLTEQTVGIESLHAPHFVAALAVAFAMTPAHGRFRSVTDKLFVHMPATDLSHSVRRINTATQSIGTLDFMLGRFSSVMHDILGAESVVILLREGKELVQVFPPVAPEAAAGVGPGVSDQRNKRLVIADNAPVVTESQAQSWPIVLDVLNRRTPSQLMAEAGRFMAANGVAACAAVRSKEVLQGLLLFGPRISGKVYGLTEQQVMQAAADQLAVAVENAVLYTEVQDSKIYNEILLDNLVNGVIACGHTGKTTVFNKEAERITGLSSHQMVGNRIDRLPVELRGMLEDALESGAKAVRNRDIVLRDAAGDPVPLQVGCGVFRSHRGNVSGALLVFSDMTVVKRLETQVRRTAHLASVGTLAAGMAHEIKNPLVTVKIFAQLLPEKFDDTEFRTTFSALVEKEVDRIDRIVNQLLKFGRPSKAQLVRTALSDVLEQALQLVHVQAQTKGVRIERQLGDGVIAGDPRLLEQAFINFFLNAIDAMESGGILTVGVSLRNEPLPVASVFENAYPDRHYNVSIADTGIGIEDEDLSQVFDPFFTARKSNGTGLGLSVAYSIIQEHGGGIDIDSEPGKGTTFHVLFPALPEGELRMLVAAEQAEAGKTGAAA